MVVRPLVQPNKKPDRTPIAAELFLRTLAERGVDYFFVNPGTDFPPIVEAFARARKSNAKMPLPILVPHENLAVAMAHGVYLMTGRPQGVMVHVNVGTANTINNVTNLSRDRAPVIVAAGRTPFTEKGSFGSRDRQIHWAQEMFDQGGMLRELVKWDYELKVPEQAADVAERAYEMTMTSPRGPVYLVLPREPLAAPVPDMPVPQPRDLPAPPYADPRSIAKLVDMIAAAERPLIITAAVGDEAGVTALGRIAERCAIPVIAHHARVVSLPASHPMHFGHDSATMVGEADLVIVIESDVPWYPGGKTPPAGCKIVQIGEDPVYQRYPMRSFPADLAIAAHAVSTLQTLETALESRLPSFKSRVEARRPRLAERAKARRADIVKAGEVAADRITPQHLSRAIGEAVGDDAIIFNEYPLISDHCPREKPGTFFGIGPAGGLGWGFGAALGAKLAAPDKLVVATLGDGAYMFINPTACHWVADKFKLPVLTVIFNNSRYNAVRRATLSMFTDGVAGEDDGRYLADLDPSPAFEQLSRAQGGFGERVERPGDLPGALERAKDAVLKEGRQALLNVICPY